MLEAGLQRIVEQLCNEGCKQVNVYIQQIESGEFPEIMQNLDGEQRRKVLTELKSIMAVYERCEINK